MVLMCNFLVIHQNHFFMKTFKTLFFAVLLLSFTACSNSGENKEGSDPAEANNSESGSSNELGQRYDLKSGIVTSKSEMPMMTGDMITILYFDDHGKKSMTENISKMSMMGQTIETHSKSITIDNMVYNWDVGQKTGTKMKLEMMKGAENMDYKKMSEEMMEQWKIKKAGTATVLGKKCDVFEMNAEGMTGKYCIWDNITMKAETSIGGMNVVIEVTDLKENPSIPSSTFKVPDDVTFTEVNMTMN